MLFLNINYEAPSLIDNYYFSSYSVFLFGGVVGSILMFNLCKIIPSFLSFPGKHSLMLLMIHPYVKMILSNFFERDISLLIMVIVVSLIVTAFLAEKFPILEGKTIIYNKNKK